MEPIHRRKQVLIVDDEPVITELLKELLTAQDFECHTATSGQAALESVAQRHFDIVISDMRMPQMSGLELLSRLRPDYPHLAFLMLTGEDDVRLGVEAMKQGADDYVVKPFQVEPLRAAIHRALEKKRLEQELDHYRRDLEEMVEQRTRQLQAALKRVENTYDETLQALGGALDLRDNETAGHSQRVTRYCLKIAESMGCNAEQLKQFARGASLHDIGKIGIPDGILLKAGRLTAEESDVMQQHVRIGYELVSRISFLAGAAEIVLTHQEHFDGTGYPQGLVGMEIPLGARIFAVADTLDAMTSDRPYRHARSFFQAREEIEFQSGRQFDPEVVRAFLSFSAETWEQYRREILAQLPTPAAISNRSNGRQRESLGPSFQSANVSAGV